MITFKLLCYIYVGSLVRLSVNERIVVNHYKASLDFVDASNVVQSIICEVLSQPAIQETLQSWGISAGGRMD